MPSSIAIDVLTRTSQRRRRGLKPKERPTKKRKKTQHEKFVELARESGADESEDSFVAKIKAISSTDKSRAPVKPRKPK
jgi:hypothetical protein